MDFLIKFYYTFTLHKGNKGNYTFLILISEYIHICIYIYIYIYMYTHTHVCVFVCTYTNMFARTLHNSSLESI